MSAKDIIGVHWNQSGHSLLYQLYRRLETVALILEKRRRHGHVATKKYIAELYDISSELKELDRARSLENHRH